MVKVVKHELADDGESVMTRHGEVKIGHAGLVLNLGELACSPESLLLEPGFLDAEVYRPRAKHGKSQEDADNLFSELLGQELPVKGEEEPEGITDDQYAELIQKLVNEGGKVNSEGYIDMQLLTAELKKLGWPVITGEKRKQLSTKVEDVNEDGVIDGTDVKDGLEDKEEEGGAQE